MDFSIRPFRTGDVDLLAEAFARWPKPRELFLRYADDVHEGRIELVVGERGSEVVGFLTIRWESSYPPFRSAGVPDISDFNVLPDARRAGVGWVLMDEAERRAQTRSATVGLGVGLYADYGSAQRLYVRRGYLPDGAGVVLRGLPVPAGTTIGLDDDPVLMFTKRLR